MARLPYLDRADVKPEHQDLLTRNINLYRALVHSPDGARAFSALGHFIRHTSRLDPPAPARDGDPAGRLSRALAL